jgi:phosphate starvation-inducible membrane PsiE
MGRESLGQYLLVASLPRSSIKTRWRQPIDPLQSAIGRVSSMSDSSDGLTRTAASLHRGIKTVADALGTLLVDAFHYLALFAIGAITVWSAVAAFLGMASKGSAELSDILLLFIYLEIGAMVGIYFKTTELPVRYLIYIAITALGRVLIEIVGAEHRTGIELLIVAAAILVLSLAVLVLRFAYQKDATDTVPVVKSDG